MELAFVRMVPQNKKFEMPPGHSIADVALFWENARSTQLVNKRHAHGVGRHCWCWCVGSSTHPEPRRAAGKDSWLATWLQMPDVVCNINTHQLIGTTAARDTTRIKHIPQVLPVGVKQLLLRSTHPPPIRPRCSRCTNHGERTGGLCNQRRAPFHGCLAPSNLER